MVIAPAYSGVNPADVLQREGKHPVPPGSPTDVPGLEVAGKVVAIGPGVSGLAVGDRAFGLVGGGGHATLVVAQERELLHVPDALADDDAAATPEAFLTAFDAIVLQAGLGPGDILLVNGASGGVGTAAVQIAAALGATVVASVRTASTAARSCGAGRRGAVGRGGLRAGAVELGGADVILELVGGPHMTGNIASLARGGRLVLVGVEARRGGLDRAARPDDAARST